MGVTREHKRHSKHVGHPEPDPRRKAWDEAVATLEGRGKTNRARMEFNNA